MQQQQQQQQQQQPFNGQFPGQAGWVPEC